ncbi:helix-turn-helix transcriptional regulator [Kineococcus rhizosphaerae]|uniref:Regulatory LuxR family protein n=1 Tax=Kineococcus rhizosphaerae TaxID=559628 RepID=A0A2T0R3D6_9ACTN|nr:LuxR C-terminal-related transcriptional regulator [Kineococcus rhizosphaerae]PRY14562.1 regulatory LuxR family protein [Kineococcus rhizosphaerae]
MLTEARLTLVRDLGLELLDAEAPQQVGLGLQFLQRLVPGDVAADVFVDGAGRAHITEVPELLVPPTATDPPDVVLTSPAIPYLLAHGRLPASRVEDLCSPREWALNPMRRELLVPHGVPHALLTAHLTTVPGGSPSIRCWGVNRSRPFRDEDVDALAAFEPFLRRAARDRAREALLLDLDHAVASGSGLLLFRAGTLSYCNDEAAELLESHRVPVETVAHLSRDVLSATQPNGTLPTARGGLRLRWRPALPGHSALVVSEAPAASAELPPLTPRQYSVLAHLSHGRTAVAIAHRLSVSERTVHKHLQNLYRTLGVNDRLNAVLVARSLGLLPVLAPSPPSERR